MLLVLLLLMVPSLGGHPCVKFTLVIEEHPNGVWTDRQMGPLQVCRSLGTGPSRVFYHLSLVASCLQDSCVVPCCVNDTVAAAEALQSACLAKVMVHHYFKPLLVVYSLHRDANMLVHGCGACL
jgi:hypothetical protein